MKLAFSILSHKTPDALFEKLLGFLSRFPDVTIAVHHDYNQSEFPEEWISKYGLHMVLPHMATKWGHISKVPATIATFEKIKEVRPDFDWLITISPNCFPLKTHEQILSFFDKARHDYYMNAFPMGLEYDSVWRWSYIASFTKKLFSIPFVSRKGKFYWRPVRMKVNRNSTPFNQNMNPYHGSDWYFLNRKVGERVISAQLAKHPMCAYLAKVNEQKEVNVSPIEVVVQTFVNNQPDLQGSIDYHRYIDWENAVDWHPNILNMDHWTGIRESPALFARKFDWNLSQSLLKHIDKFLLSGNAHDVSLYSGGMFGEPVKVK